MTHPLEEVVWHSCPKHGRVMQASTLVMIEHGYPKGNTTRCGELCAPEGSTPAEHRSRYLARARQTRHRAKP